MLTEERYFSLLNHFAGPGNRDRDEFEVALEELTGLFHCTERNVKLIVRKLQEENLIDWLPGRGRGNRSRIRFKMEREPFLLEFAKRLSQKGEYRTAFEFLHQYEEDKPIFDQFIKWLNGKFGVERAATDSPDRDVFCFPVYRAPATLDPSELYFGFDSHLVRQVFDRLLEYDSEREQITPKLAHHWESNETGTEWTFYLRKGVQFHHGKMLAAEDVVFTLERMRFSMNSWLVETMERAIAVDPRTVKVVLRQPNALFPRLMCSSCASIVPADKAGITGGDNSELPSGTGPFRIVHWSESRMELAVNEGYFLGRAYLDGVKLIFMPDDIPNVSKLKWEHLVANDSRFPAKAGSDWARIETLSKGCSLISWNRNKDGPHQSLSFRQAVNLIMDRSGLILHSGKQGYPARSFLPQEETAFGVHWHDPEAAKRLLEQSGYDGTPLRLFAGESECEDAEWIREQCESIGIPVDIRYGKKYSLTYPETAMEADAVLMCLVFADDEICELETFLQKNSIIYQHLQPGLKKWIYSLVDEIYASPSKAKRRALLQQIENRLHDEAQLLFLFHQKLNTYVHPSVRGLVINNLGWMDFKDIWLTSSTDREQRQEHEVQMAKSV